MTVKSNYVIAIATLCDWLKNLAPVFQPMRSKTKSKTNCTFYAPPFSRFERGRGNSFEFGLVYRAVCSCCDYSVFENRSMRHMFSVC